MNISFLVHASSIIIIIKFQNDTKEKKLPLNSRKKILQEKKNRNKNFDRRHQTSKSSQR